MDANPYEPIACVDDGRFQLRSSLGMAVRFAGFGLIAGLIGGYQLEAAVLKPSGSAIAMGGSGLTFGIGLVAAVALLVPAVSKEKQLSWRRMRLAALPVLAMIGFMVIGFGYDYVSRGGVPPVTVRDHLNVWTKLAFGSLPGTMIIGLGCRLIARPRSYLRFSGFLLVTAMLAGGAPLVTTTNAWGNLDQPFLLTMLFAQLAMFTMLGLIFGDTQSASGTDATSGFSEEPQP